MLDDAIHVDYLRFGYYYDLLCWVFGRFVDYLFHLYDLLHLHYPFNRHLHDAFYFFFYNAVNIDYLRFYCA